MAHARSVSKYDSSPGPSSPLSPKGGWDTHYNRGVELRGREAKCDGAIAECDSVLATNPDDKQAHNHRGIALRSKGDYDSAIAAFDRALAIDPDYTNAHYNRGIALRSKGDYVGAVAACERAWHQE
jgi:lipoprotein NlpI